LIEFFIKNNYISYANEVIRIYPVKFSSAESLWKIVIKANMNNSHILSAFEILRTRYENKDKSEEGRIFETIFNIFLEELTKSNQEVDKKKVEEIFDYLMSRKEITLKEKNIEAFLENILHFYSTNFSMVERFLLKTEKRLTPKIVETLINDYAKLGDTFSIYSLIKLTKSGRLSVVNYSQLNVSAEVLKDVMTLLMENTEIYFEENYYDKLSEGNKSYIDKHYKPQKLIDELNHEGDNEVIQQIRERGNDSNPDYAIY